MRIEAAARGPGIVRSLLQLPVVRYLHARRLLFPAMLGLAVAGVLVHGAWRRNAPDRPARRLQLSLPPIPVPELRPELEKTPLTYESDYWRQLAENARNKLVRIGPDNLPAVMIAPGVALTAIEAAERYSTPSEGMEAEASDPLKPRLLGVDADLGIALIAVKQPPAVATFAAADFSRLHPGSYIAAVSLTPAGELGVAPGHIVSILPPTEAEGASVEAALAGAEAFAAAAIVDLDGRLVGVSVRAGPSLRLVWSDAIRRVVQRAARGEICQAVEVGDISVEVLRLLGLSGGVLVEEVREAAFAPEPPIREGDVLVSWNRQAVSAAEQFVRLYAGVEPGEQVRYTVLRNRRRISGTVTMPGRDCRPVLSGQVQYAALGLTVKREAEGWRVLRVADGGAAGAAGLTAGDVIIAVNGRAIASEAGAALARLDQSRQPAALTIRRGGRTKMLALHPRPRTSQGPATEQNSK